MGLRPSTWGPVAWLFLHNFANALDSHKFKTLTLDEWYSLLLCLPCRKCRESAVVFLQTIFLQIHPEQHIDNYHSTVVYALHKRVNDKLRCQGLSPGMTLISQQVPGGVGGLCLLKEWKEYTPNFRDVIRSCDTPGSARYWISVMQFFMFSFYDIGTVWECKTDVEDSEKCVTNNAFLEILERKIAFSKVIQVINLHSKYIVGDSTQRSNQVSLVATFNELWNTAAKTIGDKDNMTHDANLRRWCYSKVPPSSSLFPTKKKKMEFQKKEDMERSQRKRIAKLLFHMRLRFLQSIRMFENDGDFLLNLPPDKFILFAIDHEKTQKEQEHDFIQTIVKSDTSYVFSS